MRVEEVIVISLLHQNGARVVDTRAVLVYPTHVLLCRVFHLEVNMLPDWLLRLLESGAVWTALLALVNIVIKYVWPNLPAEILTAVNVLLVAILAALGVNVSNRVRAYRTSKK
jgi:hypothetical protein